MTAKGQACTCEYVECRQLYLRLRYRGQPARTVDLEVLARMRVIGDAEQGGRDGDRCPRRRDRDAGPDSAIATLLPRPFWVILMSPSRV